MHDSIMKSLGCLLNVCISDVKNVLRPRLVSVQHNFEDKRVDWFLKDARYNSFTANSQEWRIILQSKSKYIDLCTLWKLQKFTYSHRFLTIISWKQRFCNVLNSWFHEILFWWERIFVSSNCDISTWSKTTWNV